MMPPSMEQELNQNRCPTYKLALQTSHTRPCSDRYLAFDSSRKGVNSGRQCIFSPSFYHCTINRRRHNSEPTIDADTESHKARELESAGEQRQQLTESSVLITYGGYGVTFFYASGVINWALFNSRYKLKIKYY